MMSSPSPTEIRLMQKPRLLFIAFDNNRAFSIPCYFLRIHSPSAEMRGHGIAASPEKIAQVSTDVNIIAIESVGNYAVKFIFDDGHQTGIYSWNYLYELGIKYESVDHQK